MNASICYFSGTGNSLTVAKKISEYIINSELLPIESLREDNIDIQTEIVGFVFPVYCVDVPDFIIEVISRLNIDKSQYIFAAVTCGGTPGNTLSTISKLLQQKNKILNYGYEIFLGDNSIVYHTEAKELENRIYQIDDICLRIAKNALLRESSNITYQENYETIKLKHTLHKLLSEDLQIQNKTADSLICSSCELCIKVCPSNNIIKENNRIKWGENCLMCFSCLNLCPNASIRFGKIAPTKDQQYKYPGIKLSELIRR